MTKKQYVLSLVFPMIMFLSHLLCIIVANYQYLSPVSVLSFWLFGGFVLGGIIPIILIFCWKTDLSHFTIFRGVFYVVGIIWLIFGNPKLSYTEVLPFSYLICGLLAIYYAWYIKKHDLSFKCLLVLVLSEPLAYFALVLYEFGRTFSINIPG